MLGVVYLKDKEYDFTAKPWYPNKYFLLEAFNSSNPLFGKTHMKVSMKY